MKFVVKFFSEITIACRYFSLTHHFPLVRFGEEVRKRELGLDDLGDTEELFPCLPNHQLAAKGEVALEFQAEVERVEMERQKEKE